MTAALQSINAIGIGCGGGLIAFVRYSHAYLRYGSGFRTADPGVALGLGVDAGAVWPAALGRKGSAMFAKIKLRNATGPN
jgi:hypothetical protein